jgi:hypothetical protein
LHARCLVLDDGTTRLAFVVCDALNISRVVSDRAKRLIEQETGLPGGNVITAAVHTHSAMRSTDILTTGDPQRAYDDFLARRMADGVKRAVNNLAPARIGWGQGALPGQVFNRRWYTRSVEELRNPFGGVDRVRMNPPMGSPDLIKPAGPVDPEIIFFSVQTANGRPLALLANYSLHYVAASGRDVSADTSHVRRPDQEVGCGSIDPPFVRTETERAEHQQQRLSPERAQGEPSRKCRWRTRWRRRFSLVSESPIPDWVE